MPTRRPSSSTTGRRRICARNRVLHQPPRCAGASLAQTVGSARTAHASRHDSQQRLMSSAPVCAGPRPCTRQPVHVLALDNQPNRMLRCRIARVQSQQTGGLTAAKATLRRSRIRAAASRLVLSRTVNGSGVITSATLPRMPGRPLTAAHIARATPQTSFCSCQSCLSKQFSYKGTEKNVSCTAQRACSHI